tara:strand:- start:23126 stop:23800 length:675 start_codon:yes stop_codon:yes gene_type:complete
MVGIPSADTDNLTDSRNDAIIPSWHQAGTDPVALPDGVETLSTNASHGCDVAFLRRLHSRGLHRAVGVKYAANGQGLEDFFKPTKEGYDNIMTACAQAQRDFASVGIKWRSLVWVQGQHDSSTEAESSAYEANLNSLVDQLRIDLKTPDLFFCSPLHPPSWSTKDYDAEVRAAVAAYVASEPLSLSVDAEDTDTRDGGIHYEAESFEILGNRMAEAYLVERPKG